MSELGEKVARLETLILDLRDDIKELKNDLKAAGHPQKIATLEAVVGDLRDDVKCVQTKLMVSSLKLERVDTRSALMGGLASAIIAGVIALIKVLGV